LNDHLKMIKTNKITHLLPVFCIINLNIVSWTFLCYFHSHSQEFDSFEKGDFNINLHGDYKSYENLEFCWNFRNFKISWKFWIFLKISEFSLIDDAVRVFRIKIKLLCNPVAELIFRENDSHCRSMVLKTMDCSIVKQLEKEKYSNFNVENFVVMFIYWGPIINVIPRFWLGIKYYSLMFSWQVEFWLAKQILLTFQGSRAVTENQ
jgi:hypothetical protein